MKYITKGQTNQAQAQASTLPVTSTRKRSKDLGIPSGLTPSPKMKKTIERIAKKCKVRLDEKWSFIRIVLDDGELIIDQGSRGIRISDGHIVKACGRKLCPDILFWIDDDGHWFPYAEIRGEYHFIEYMDDDGPIVPKNAGKKTGTQADLANFVEKWAEQIVNDGWLEKGYIRKAYSRSTAEF